LVSDGRVYSSQFEIALEYVLMFQKEIRQMNDCPDVSVIGLGDFLPVTPEADKRASLLTLFGQSLEKVEELLKADANFNRVYCGFKHFMMEELNFPADMSFKKRRQKCSVVAREMMRSNDAYGRLVECLYSNHIRLSIHPHSNVEKVGMTLVTMTPGSDIQWGTPWHNCAVMRKSGNWELVRLNVANQRGYELCKPENGLQYFIEKDTPVNNTTKPKEDPNQKFTDVRRIFVCGIPNDATDDNMKEFFSNAGTVVNVEYFRLKKKLTSYAFLTFSSASEAAWAVENMNGVSYTGVCLRVEFQRNRNSPTPQKARDDNTITQG